MPFAVLFSFIMYFLHGVAKLENIELGYDVNMVMGAVS
jgi:hypothetical protein